MLIVLLGWLIRSAFVGLAAGASTDILSPLQPLRAREVPSQHSASAVHPTNHPLAVETPDQFCI